MYFILCSNVLKDEAFREKNDVLGASCTFGVTFDRYLTKLNSPHNVSRRVVTNCTDPLSGFKNDTRVHTRLQYTTCPIRFQQISHNGHFWKEWSTGVIWQFSAPCRLSETWHHKKVSQRLARKRPSHLPPVILMPKLTQIRGLFLSQDLSLLGEKPNWSMVWLNGPESQVRHKIMCRNVSVSLAPCHVYG